MSRVPAGIWVRHALRRMDLAILLGLALLAATAALQIAVLEPIETRQAEVARRIAKAREPGRQATAETSAAEIVAALPGREDLETTLGAIHQLAADHGIAIPSAEYKSRRDTGADFTRHEILLPVKAGYGPLRRWLAALMEQQPAIAIDELALRRDTAENDRIDAQMKLTLFVRQRGSASPDTRLPARIAPVDEIALFAARSWQPPPPPPPPPAKPTAPPLPFKYAGKLLDDGAIQVFLTQGNATALVKEGDQIGNYDVEQITATTLTMNFRPLNEKQTLNIGAKD